MKYRGFWHCSNRFCCTFRPIWWRLGGPLSPQRGLNFCLLWKSIYYPILKQCWPKKAALFFWKWPCLASLNDLTTKCNRTEKYYFGLYCGFGDCHIHGSCLWRHVPINSFVHGLVSIVKSPNTSKETLGRSACKRTPPKYVFLRYILPLLGVCGLLFAHF
jgi:hypothetical protein